MEELGRHIPRIDNDDDDDDGYDTPVATESWDDACNDYASFLEHTCACLDGNVARLQRPRRATTTAYQ